MRRGPDHCLRIDSTSTMLSHAVVANSCEKFRPLLQLRAKDLFTESEIHSTVDCLQECITEAGTQLRPNGISSMSVNNITGLDLLLGAGNTTMKGIISELF